MGDKMDMAVLCEYCIVMPLFKYSMYRYTIITISSN